MRRAWLAVALLSASWLMGLEYYEPPVLWAWWAAVAGAVALLCGLPVRLRMPSRGEAAVAALMAMPAIWFAPGIYRAIPVLIVVGAAATALAPPLDWVRRLASAALIAGAILLVQALAMYGYEALTARSHELPEPLARGVGAVARLIGADSALDRTLWGYDVELFTMRRVHPIGATWELLLDPATLCFLVGGMLLVLVAGGDGPGRRQPAWALAVITVAWLPLRVALLLGLYLHRALLTDYDAALNLMNQFFSPWTYLVLLGAPVLLAWRFARRSDAEQAQAQAAPAVPPPPAATSSAWGWPSVWPAAAACLGAATLVVGLFWCPSGAPKTGGRLLWDEQHSKWEPTQRAYDTSWYGADSGYNYYCIYDYCSHFYDTHRIEEPIKPGVLRPDDVLIIKVPTAPYAPEEVQEIERFVSRGGGLMCIGEHTDVFGTGTHLNQVTRPLGFTYRFDCVFGIRSVFEELYEPPLLAHPIVQRMPPLDFEISCSIDPGVSWGKTPMRGTGLKNAFADYHASNFYPQVDDFPDSRYGAFVQMWAAEHGAGRVVAFSDSTQFSNFSTFEPGKPQMMIGMVEWLRHRNAGASLPLLAVLGAALAAAGVLGALIPARRRWSLMVCAGLLGWSCAVPCVRAMNRAALPEPKPQRKMTRVAIDRTVCDAILSKAGFIGGRPEGFGIFERWILRLGWFTSRESGDRLFDSDLIVFLQPHLPVERRFRDHLAQYVHDGGNVLVIDSPENEHSTANSLLFPFKLSLKRPLDPSATLAGTVVPARGLPLPQLPVTSALEVEGGMPVAHLVSGAASAAQPTTVAAGGPFGKGTVTVIGFGSRFNDVNMGVTGDIEPGDALRSVYEFEYELLRRILKQPAAGKPATAPASPPTTTTALNARDGAKQ